MGFEDEADAIASAATAGDRIAMAEGFSERIAKDVLVIGDAGIVVDGLLAYVDAGVTVPVVSPLTQPPATLGAR